MLGWLTGDGVFNNDTVALVFGPTRTAHRRTHDVPELNELKAVAAASSGCAPARASNVATQRNGVMQTATSQTSLVSLSGALLRLPSGDGHRKDVPKRVHRVTEDLKVAYLQGLFSADGCMRSDARATEPEVMLASSSPACCVRFSYLLADLGMTSRITWTTRSAARIPRDSCISTISRRATSCRSSASRARSPRKRKPKRFCARPFNGAHQESARAEDRVDRSRWQDAPFTTSPNQ